MENKVLEANEKNASLEESKKNYQSLKQELETELITVTLSMAHI
jgi:hypothetical protein